MSSPAWFVARHDLLYMLRRRETLLWTFVMPIVFFYFIGTVTSETSASSAILVMTLTPSLRIVAPPDATR